MATDRLDFLRQEFVDGPTRSPAMPDVQVAAHIRELGLLEQEFSIDPPRPKIDLKYIQRLGHLPGCHLFDDGPSGLAT